MREFTFRASSAVALIIETTRCPIPDMFAVLSLRLRKQLPGLIVIGREFIEWALGNSLIRPHELLKGGKLLFCAVIIGILGKDVLQVCFMASQIR
jgi:hypothetical protein